MAEADIAFVAAAGAAGLALSVSAWAWRLRGRCAGQLSAMRSELDGARSALARYEAAAAAFDDARVEVGPDADARLRAPMAIGSPRAVAALAAIRNASRAVSPS